MPWKETRVMDERMKFVGRLLGGEKMAPLLPGVRDFTTNRAQDLEPVQGEWGRCHPEPESCSALPSQPHAIRSRTGDCSPEESTLFRRVHNGKPVKRNDSFISLSSQVITESWVTPISWPVS